LDESCHHQQAAVGELAPERFIAPLKGGPMLRLRDIMTRDVISATPDMTIRDAMELLSERHVSGAPVVDGGKIVGIFSATDILALLADLNDTTPSLTFRRRRARTAPLEDVTVDEVMTRKVQSLPPDCSVDEAAALMGKKQIHRVLVMLGDTLLGIVTTSDVAKAVAEHRIRSRTYVFG
jgi:CBS domain-containing protein